MAMLSIGTTHGITRKAWDKKNFNEYLLLTALKQYMGTGPNAVIQVKTDLAKGIKGDRITISLIAKLTGAGQTGSNTLENNEEDLDIYTQNITVDQIRHGVSLGGKMDEKRSAIELRTNAKFALNEWNAEKLVNDFFTQMTTSPTTNRIKYGGTSNAAESDVAVGDTSTLAEIANLKSMALTGNGGAARKIRPYMTKGGLPYYVLLMETYAYEKLSQSSTFLTASQDALARGDKNPIFTGAGFIWNGVIIKPDTNVPTALTGTSSCRIARNVLMGAQAASIAYGCRPESKEREWDYGDKVGFAVREIRGLVKNVFDSEDHGCMNYITSAPLT